jgi:ABC-2 type transport system permease protein
VSATATERRMHGPSAFDGGIRHFYELTLTLARTEFKLRYYGSVLGYLWSLMRPLLFFGVLYVFFTRILNIGKGIPHYGVYLLTGIVLWNYFLEATTISVTSLVDREALIRKIRFPRMVVPLSVSLTSVFNLGMNLIAVLVFTLANGISPRLSWLWMIPIVIGFIILATGASMLLSALYVRFRDVKPIWDVSAQVLFYASPIMYLAHSYKALEHYAMASPFATMLTQMGYAYIHPAPIPVRVNGVVTLDQQMRSATAAAGGPLPVAIALLIIATVFVVGLWVFSREAPRVAERL